MHATAVSLPKHHLQGQTDHHEALASKIPGSEQLIQRCTRTGFLIKLRLAANHDGGCTTDPGM